MGCTASVSFFYELRSARFRLKDASFVESFYDFFECSETAVLEGLLFLCFFEEAVPWSFLDLIERFALPSERQDESLSISRLLLDLFKLFF